jgi:hypothetical protein
VAGKPQAELLVGPAHLGGLGVAQVPGGVRAFFDQGLDLLADEGVPAGGRLAQPGLGGEPLGLGLRDPLADLLGIAAGIEGSPVAAHLHAGFLDPGHGCLRGGTVGVCPLAGHDLVDGVTEAVTIETKRLS